MAEKIWRQIDSGPQAWRQRSNHNRMIELQTAPPVPGPGPVELAFFGSSAFRITSPGGITVMIDPWRNLPTGKWDWYFHDFPITAVDIGVSTHAHFDHDALNRLDAHVLLDRPIGRYEFGDVAISGIADKHAIGWEHALYDSGRIHKRFLGVDVAPPNNPRSWDHCLVMVETGDLRILHWGDNRPDAPDEIWAALGAVDILLLPVDGSQHVFSNEAVRAVIDRLKPKIIMPHHYYIWDVVQRGSTLLPVENWVQDQGGIMLSDPARTYTRADIADLDRVVHCFGDHVAFDRDRWHEEAGGTYPAP